MGLKLSETHHLLGTILSLCLPLASHLLYHCSFVFHSSDIDECKEERHNCHVKYGVCTNQAPYFFCTCALGSKGNGIDCVG